jgi:outer membrane protein assembly factor BamE (lipoprotein component of BamABCDE complex)
MAPGGVPVNRERAPGAGAPERTPSHPQTPLNRMMRSVLRRVSGLAAIAAIAACTPMIDTRGNMPPPEIVATIQPGVTTRTQISQLLGSPSSVATFNDRTWYYIGRKTETVAFLSPEVTEQQILVVKFDESGVVQDLEKRGIESARLVSMNERETPTAGHSLGFFEQLFGNIGRFSSKEEKPKSGTSTTTSTSRGGY